MSKDTIYREDAIKKEERRKAAEWFRNRAKGCPMPATRRMYEIAIEALEELNNSKVSEKLTGSEKPNNSKERSEFVKVSDRECPWCKAVCASTDKYCHECGWHIADTPQTDCETCKYGQDKHRYAHICNECGVGINNYTPQTESQNSNKNSNVILVDDEVGTVVRCAMCSNPNKSDRGCDGACSYDEKLYERIMKAIVESTADTPQPDCEACELDGKAEVCKICRVSNYEPQPECPWK